MINFDKIVKKLLKKWWKIVFNKDILEIIDPEKKAKNKVIVNKIIYRLKSSWILIPIRNWVYLIPADWDNNLNSIDLIEKYYYKLIKKYINFYCLSDYYISSEKALEFHLKNYEVPLKLFVVNREINKKIKIWNYWVIFKTIKWNLNWKSINLFSRLEKMTTTINIEWINLKISNLELSIVENAVINDSEIWVNVYLLNKALKKYSKVLNYDNFYKIGELKYIMAFNRLKELSKWIDKNLYELFLDIIKKNGWLFIWEWLRKI